MAEVTFSGEVVFPRGKGLSAFFVLPGSGLEKKTKQNKKTTQGPASHMIPDSHKHKRTHPAKHTHTAQTPSRTENSPFVFPPINVLIKHHPYKENKREHF